MSVVDTIWGHIWSKHRKLTLFVTIEWAFLIIYGILSYLYMGQLIQLMINQSLVMSPKSDLFKLWQDPPVQPELRSRSFSFLPAHCCIKCPQNLQVKTLLQTYTAFTCRIYNKIL